MKRKPHKDMSNRNITTASKYLHKEIEKLRKEQELWILKESVARENASRVNSRISDLNDQILLIEGRTAYASL